MGDATGERSPSEALGGGEEGVGDHSKESQGKGCLTNTTENHGSCSV